MKLNYLLLLFILNISFSKAQNFAASYSQQPTCFGECNGTITFTTNAVTGPFTAVITNTGTCPNSTVQSSTPNSITINSVCACSGVYTITMYTGTIVVGSEIFQFVNYSTSAFVINTGSVSIATCSNCCDASFTATYTGGNTTAAPSFSVDGISIANVTPASNICPGTHTVCAQDQSNCIACKVFTVNYTSTVGLKENGYFSDIKIFPNPANNELFIEATTNNPISKIEIFDLAGRKNLESTIIDKSEVKTRIDLSSLSGGLYYLNFYNIQGQLMHHKKFVKSN